MLEREWPRLEEIKSRLPVMEASFTRSEQAAGGGRVSLVRRQMAAAGLRSAHATTS